MANNTLGKIFSVLSFGESHGSAVGCVIDGMLAGVAIDLEKIQNAVDLRKTGRTNYGSERQEEDQVEIISGLVNGVTLGSPIAILIKNKDAQSKDYSTLQDVFRPNHADFTNLEKYGIRDANGGGRTSIRITAPMVAAGAIAEQFLHQLSDIKIISYTASIGGLSPSANFDASISQEHIYENAFRLLEKSDAIEALINEVKEKGDTLGGTIHTQILNMPAGLGEPIFYKLQAALGQAMLSINTVKGFEYGDGFASSSALGSDHNDEFYSNDMGEIKTKTNHSGGIQGGISNGMPIGFSVAFKPISSIKQIQQTVNEKGNNIALEIKGRHDVCAVPRAVPIVRAYTAIILADFLLQNRLSKI